MSSKSKNSKQLVPEIPEKFLVQARPIAARYQMILWEEDGQCVGRGVELPTIFGAGDSVAECVETTRRHLTIAVASYLADGETPPPPANFGKRDQQVNVRMSAAEKLLLETKAAQHGTGLSDYIRAVALEK